MENAIWGVKCSAFTQHIKLGMEGDEDNARKKEISIQDKS